MKIVFINGPLNGEMRDVPSTTTSIAVDVVAIPCNHDHPMSSYYRVTYVPIDAERTKWKTSDGADYRKQLCLDCVAEAEERRRKRERKERIGEKTAVMREFGNSVVTSHPLPEEMRKVAEDMLLHSCDELLEYCPDKIFGMEPTIVNPPPLDRLQKFSSIGVKFMFASPIYDYFYQIKEDALKEREKNVKRKLAYQSRKSWWTRLCWKLGGFDLKDESYLEENNE